MKLRCPGRYQNEKPPPPYKKELKLMDRSRHRHNRAKFISVKYRLQFLRCGPKLTRDEKF